MLGGGLYWREVGLIEGRRGERGEDYEFYKRNTPGAGLFFDNATTVLIVITRNRISGICLHIYLITKQLLF